MARPSLSALLLASALAFVAVPLPAAGQGVVQPVPGTTDADRLAAQMRLLAGNPGDLSALLAAGELSLKLDDLGAAASFFARADKIDPHNGRAKAGEASILVHAERPGEALRYFALAESYGLAPAAFAGNRGLAYDLIGEQERAQRDYRLALRAAPDEETQRRYALSLGISGKRELAEQQLQPLLRRSDRGAWRAHAFVLAMSGNVAEASRIATTMMPPGTAAGLQPFLERLPTLAAVDRAFAVHFGEVRSTPQRVADARLVPALPALGPDPYAPRQAVAVAVAAPADKEKRRGKEHGRDKGKREPVQVAVATPAPEPLPQAPRYGAPATPVATRGSAPAAWPTSVAPTRAPVTLAASRPVFAPPAAVTQPLPGVARPASTGPAVIATSPTRAPVATAAVSSAPVRAAAATTTVRAAPPAVVPASAAPVAPPAIVVMTPAPVVAIAAVAPPPPTVAPTAVADANTAAAPITLAAAEPAQPRRDDTELSRIVANLPIPASELGVAGPVRPAATPSPAAVEERPPAVTAEDREPVAKIAAERAAADKLAADKAAAEKAERAAAAKALADKRAADRKAAAEKKALAEKKAAAEEKAEEAREAAAQKKLERANPERIWVQVAGGAYEGDLPKAWAATKKKGGDVFAGHATGWTTPLRFTNRVLAGPFKTDDDARAFVNKLKTKGLSGFTFTSEAGQVVKKLEAE